jgi:hypothetical protein
MKYVLVTISEGIVSEVCFYTDVSRTVKSLSDFVKAMNPERYDAAVYGPSGMITNAKDFLDENDQHVDHSE